ncbi:MAG: tRNA lysidine(34) synthetase TilS [Cellvibrionaceae bacterium]|nr:tRNA lysidine(34) synthetase TilS [Cellvibrionaceae bacterium]
MSSNRSKALLESGLDGIAYKLRDARTVWLGYSGGLDSTVLLYLMNRVGCKVKALHVNHQLSMNANFWEQHCRRFAQSMGLEFVAERVKVFAQGSGLESAARDKRYQVFDQYVGQDDVLLLAHHADDQLETLIYRIMRGTGLKGLAGIVAQRPLRSCALDSGRLLRPLLPVSRRAILEYARDHKLDWVSDESNAQTTFDRNYIRSKVVPHLAQRWPDAAEQAASTAHLVASSIALLNEYAAADLAACDQRVERMGESLCLQQLMSYSQARKRHVLRCWVEHCGFSMPSQAQLMQLDLLISAKDDAQPELQWGQCVFHRFQGRLYMHSPIPEQSKRALAWRGEGEIDLPLGKLKLRGQGRGLKPGSYAIQFRQVGERCKPAGRAHSQTLKKLFQEYKLEPWLRDYVPILYLQGEIAAVGDLFICEGFVCDQGWQQSWLIE